ncbi:GNAT family N-acetyltransferase [Actinopolymorpha pittospori]|uniref:GNAT superfamily N-acetyltransferase n=1 Tax=Actinopolymorpha pittospori TaxID=648752 RepID=A0A927RGA7_9ACTN|nr:GNAT family N-acetyltransferase [Actinopolymorpha pittospori]MBE1610995.1 GNAT superfamily N-acetyltransferase [Actinopolymorpha pittospori]
MSFIAAYEPDREGGTAPAAEIRTATRSDATVLALLEQGVRPGDVDARIASLCDAVEDPEHLVVLASVDSEPVGYGRVAYLARDVDDAPAGYYLAGVTVARRWRRRGLAADLTAARLAWIWRRSEVAWYFSNVQNLASLALHETFGFVEADRSPSFQGITFAGGVGVLLRAGRPVSDEVSARRGSPDG